MLVVVSITLVLAGMAIPRFSDSVKTAKVAKIKADMQTIVNAAELYRMDTGKDAETVEDLLANKEGAGYLHNKPLLPDKTEYTLKNGIVTCKFDSTDYSSEKM